MKNKIYKKITNVSLLFVWVFKEKNLTKSKLMLNLSYIKYTIG